MDINKKCICGAMWKAKGIPQRVADKVLLEWDIEHGAHGLRTEQKEWYNLSIKREKEFFETMMKRDWGYWVQ